MGRWTLTAGRLPTVLQQPMWARPKRDYTQSGSPTWVTGHWARNHALSVCYQARCGHGRGALWETAGPCVWLVHSLSPTCSIHSSSPGRKRGARLQACWQSSPHYRRPASLGLQLQGPPIPGGPSAGTLSHSLRACCRVQGLQCGCGPCDLLRSIFHAATKGFISLSTIRIEVFLGSGGFHRVGVGCRLRAAGSQHCCQLASAHLCAQGPSTAPVRWGGLPSLRCPGSFRRHAGEPAQQHPVDERPRDRPRHAAHLQGLPDAEPHVGGARLPAPPAAPCTRRQHGRAGTAHREPGELRQPVRVQPARPWAWGGTCCRVQEGVFNVEARQLTWLEHSLWALL